MPVIVSRCGGRIAAGFKRFGLVWIIFYAIRATDQSNMPQKS